MKKLPENRINQLYMKAARILSAVILHLLLLSCTQKSEEVKQNVLSVTIGQNELAPSDLFRDIEIIPLETSDESLIKAIGRIIEDKDRYYILDTQQSVVFCFNKQGRFLYKIDKNGSGPDEYHLIYEMIVKPDRNLIYLLSPMGAIYTYDLDGNFIKKDLLPVGGQQDMIEIGNDLIACWTLFGPPDDKVIFYDLNAEKVVGGFWKDTDDTFMSNMCIDVFYQYKGDNYFSTQFANEVYRFTKDTVELAYTWDFGSDNLYLEPFKDKVKEDPNIFPQLTETLEIPYYFFRQFQNKDYYYTIQANWSIDQWRNIFYRKKDGKSYVFDTLTGGAKIKDISHFTDEYMISVIPPEEIDLYKSILSPKELSKIKDLQEDSNFCLAKFHFNQE